MQKTKGFTLVELLVVISIIALLMSMLMPALSKARQQAQAVVCQSSLKQLSLGFHFYTQDNDGYMMEDAHDGRHNNWLIALYPRYIPDKKALLCASAKKPALPNGAAQRYPGSPSYSFIGSTKYAWGEMPSGVEQWLPKGITSGYGINECVYNVQEDLAKVMRYKMEAFWRKVDVKGGSNIPVLGDCKWLLVYATDKQRAPILQDWRTWELGDFAIPRHNKAINMIFLDGSVRKVGLKELWKLEWSRVFDVQVATAAVLPWPDWMRGFKEY